MKVSRRSIGINFNDDGIAEISVWAPLKNKVEIMLSNGDRISLSKNDEGYWLSTTNRIKPGDKYKVAFDDADPLPDPASVAQPDGVHGPSQALQLKSFQWSDAAWNNVPLKDYVLYELHVGTFTSEGTFAALESKLDYLKDLGINAIEVMPIAQFPGGRNWGYDGVFPFAVQQSYGGADGLQRLVNACHAKGIAVVLDVVYNHLGPEGNYLGSFGPYFTDKYKTPWGNALNFDDEYCDGVRQYFIENVLMWFRDFHIDALRLDAVHAIKDFSARHILKEIKQQVDELMEETKSTHHLIVELDLNDTRFIEPLEQQGFGMDAQWVDEFHHALRLSSGQAPTGYYSDFNGIKHLAKAYKDAYVYDGQYSPHRKKKFGIKAENNPGDQFIVFSQNHDQVGNRMLGERTSTLVSYEMQKLLAAAVIISPYIPMLFMGEEYAEPNPFLYFVSHTDKELADAVRIGRKREFEAFHAEGEAPDPVAEETYNQSKLQWHLLEQEPYKTMHQYYKTLLAFRKKYLPITPNSRKNVNVQVDEVERLLILEREEERHRFICILNFSTKTVTPSLKIDTSFKTLFDSSGENWKKDQSTNVSLNEGQVSIQPESILILSTSTL